MNERLQPFRFWCHKVLPLVYDDSLSYYELLCKVYDYCINLGEAMGEVEKTVLDITTELKQLYEKFENLKDNLGLEMLVDEKLEQMLADGEFDDIVARTYKSGMQKPWFVRRFSDDTFQASRVDYTRHEKDYQVGAFYLTKPRYVELPFPIDTEYIGNVANIGSHHGYVTDMSVTGGVGLQYRVCVPSDFEVIDVSTRLFINSPRRPIPKAPTIAYNASGAQQALEVAQSYVDAQLSGRKFAYGKNFFYGGYNVINNSNGAGTIECDTYAGLIMRGIKYEQSPYANTTPGYEFAYESLPVNPNNYPWVARLLETITNNKFLGRDARFAGDYASISWQISGCIFSELANAKAGDLVFWRKPGTIHYFDNISHIAMLDYEVENGVEVPYIYEVTSAGNSDGKVVHKRPLEGRMDYCYFGRINYSA